METSQSESEPVAVEPPRPIYEAVRAQATKDPLRRDRILSGAIAGIALWLIVVELGVPHIFGLPGIGLLPGAIVLGGGAGYAGWHRHVINLAFGLTVLLLIVAFTPLMEAPTDRIVRRDPVPRQADAIVVLSAGVSLDGMVGQQGMDRLLKGIELARAGVAPRLILTRERKQVGGKWITSEADQQRLAAFAETQVLTTGYSTSTREEAMRVRAIAEQQRWKRVVLVTSPFHSRRACATFEKTGLTVSCIPADSRDIAVGNLEGADDRVRAFAMWSYELVGTLRYWASDWI